MTVDVIAKLENFLETEKVVDTKLDGIMERARATSPDQKALGSCIFQIVGDRELAHKWLRMVAHCRRATAS